MNITPLMGLHYPGPGDAPCDFDDDWCTFTGDIDAVFDKWEAGLNRTLPAVPAAVLLLTTAAAAPVTILNFNPVPFTEVVLDTAGMTSLDADPYGITIRISGRYTVAAYTEQDTSGSVDAQSSISAGPISNIILDRGAGVQYYNNAYTAVVDLTEGTRVTLTTFVSPAPTRICRGAWLAVVWHSDTERP